MNKRILRPITTLLTTAVLLSTGTGFAQQAPSPFYNHALALSQAFGLELITSRLFAIEALAGDYGDFLEQAEKLLGRDFRRFGGSLAASDGALAAELESALAAVIADVTAGRDAGDTIAAARAAQARAYAVLIPSEVRNSTGFVAMTVADLLLQDDGVAEAYEDAAGEDLWEYPNGFGALEQVKFIWRSELASSANDQQREDFEEMIEFLERVVYTGVRPPDAITGDPEEAESATQRMTGILESVGQSDLYPARDLRQMAGHLAGMLEPACAAYAAGHDAVAVETIYAVRNPYRKNLRRLLDLIAPEIHAPAAAHLDALISRNPPEDRPAACLELQELLIQARAAL
jgi:hypothetical protein